MNVGQTEADDKLGATRLQQRVVTDELRTLLMSTCGSKEESAVTSASTSTLAFNPNASLTAVLPTRDEPIGISRSNSYTQTTFPLLQQQQQEQQRQHLEYSCNQTMRQSSIDSAVYEPVDRNNTFNCSRKRAQKLASAMVDISRLRDVRPPECHEHPRDYDDYSSNDVGCTISQRARTFSGHSVVVVAKVFATHSGGSDEPAIIAGLQDCKYVVQLVRSRVLDGHNYVMLLEWLDTEFHKSPHQQTLEGATKCAQQLLAGLVFFAERGLVHMDIKPSNIGWSHTRRCWIIFDFSVARYGRAGDGRHNSSDRCGTTRYMAPEVEQPEDYDGWCDCRADVYSLGMSLQVMFNSVTDTAAVSNHHLLVNAVQLMCEQYRDQRRTAAEILRILDR